MKVVSIYDQKSHLTPGPSLNVRQLLNPIFFSLGSSYLKLLHLSFMLVLG